MIRNFYGMMILISLLAIQSNALATPESRFLHWLETVNDPQGTVKTMLSNISAVGFPFQAEGAIFGLTGHADLFKTPRKVVLSTKKFWAKIYDFPNPGDFAIWDRSTIEFHYASGHVEYESLVPEQLRNKSKWLIKDFIEKTAKGKRTSIRWNFSQAEILYFLFSGLREQFMALHPATYVNQAKDLRIDKIENSKQWSYVLKMKIDSRYGQSDRKTVFIDKDGRIGKIESNLDLLDGGRGLMPIVQVMSDYQVSPQGIAIPKVHFATLQWNKFKSEIRELVEEEVDGKMDKISKDIFSVFAPVATVCAAFLIDTDGLVDETANGIVDQIKNRFFSFSHVGMDGRIGEFNVYFNDSQIP